jgi:chemotaxis response regulator CheB
MTGRHDRAADSNSTSADGRTKWTGDGRERRQAARRGDDDDDLVLRSFRRAAVVARYPSENCVAAEVHHDVIVIGASSDGMEALTKLLTCRNGRPK